MDLSLETLSRDFSDGQLADTDSCIVRGPRSNAKTCAIEPFQHETFFVIICDYLSDYLSFFLSLCLYLSLFVFLYHSFPLVLSHALCIYHVSFLNVSLVSPTKSLCIFVSVYVLLFLGRDARNSDHLHGQAL